ncbi:uncharacterized protein LOC122849081 isoform X3 [Aphidius gifuensis]|uniref:uncharacterized protein LOC122849081 isoform X3 n=1 Tax=Aphidius gifuensis TaxID=684658 RepID=UPI001CDBF271|nr:uncharacterized protein LOC122849081 isoform X3 [Aphidius gifuensis]
MTDIFAQLAQMSKAVKPSQYALVQWADGVRKGHFTPDVPIGWIKDFSDKKFLNGEQLYEIECYPINKNGESEYWRKPLAQFHNGRIIEISDSQEKLERTLKSLGGKKYSEPAIHSVLERASIPNRSLPPDSSSKLSLNFKENNTEKLNQPDDTLQENLNEIHNTNENQNNKTVDSIKNSTSQSIRDQRNKRRDKTPRITLKLKRVQESIRVPEFISEDNYASLQENNSEVVSTHESPTSSTMVIESIRTAQNHLKIFHKESNEIEEDEHDLNEESSSNLEDDQTGYEDITLEDIMNSCSSPSSSSQNDVEKDPEEDLILIDFKECQPISDLKNTLRNSVLGINVLNYYRTEENLLLNHRVYLADAILNIEMRTSHDMQITPERFFQLANMISELFPTEKTENYYVPSTCLNTVQNDNIPATGKLCERYKFFHSYLRDENKGCRTVSPRKSTRLSISRT